MSAPLNHLSRCCLALALAALVGCGSTEETSSTSAVPEGGPADPAVGDCPAKAPVLACGQPALAGIAVDAENVYYGVDGAIMKVPILGGDAVAIVRLAMPADAIAVHGKEVFWIDHDGSVMVNGGSVHKVAIEGGIPVLIASTADAPSAIAVDDQSVYWIDGAAVVKAPTAGGGAPTMLAPAHLATAIAVDGASVYWTELATSGALDAQDGRLMRVPLQGGAPVVIAADQPSPTAVAVDATNVYWATYGTTHAFKPLGDGAVNRMALAGDTSIVTLVQGDAGDVSTRSAPAQIAVSAGSVYWLDDIGGSVGKIPIAGGAPETVSEGKKSQREIAADPERVYFLDAMEGTVTAIDP